MTGDFDARFEDLKRRFVERSRGDLTVIEQALAAPHAIDREALRAVVHRLSGAAGTFGFAELSRVAGEADDRLMIADAPWEAKTRGLVRALRGVLG